MANVVLKSDFRDGDLLFAQQLNNNFKAIQKALETMNGVIWQDNAEMVVTFRGTTEEINERDIIDGQILYDVLTGETYIDYDGKRISTGSGNAIHIGENEPTNPSTQVWIESDEVGNMLSEVVNNLDDNRTDKAPSVAAVNNCNKYSTEEIFTGKHWVDGKKVYRRVINNIEVVSGVGIEAAAGLSIIDKVTKLEGLFYNESTRQYITIPSYYNPDTFITANFSFTGDSILIDCEGFNGYGYIVIEYTKTTDTVEESEVVSNEV